MTLEILTNAGLWTYAFVTFDFLRTILRIFVIFTKEDVYEIVLIIGETANYYFSATIFIELLKCWCEVFTIVLGCMLIQTGYRTGKDWWRTVFAPNMKTDFWLIGKKMWKRRVRLDDLFLILFWTSF